MVHGVKKVVVHAKGMIRAFRHARREKAVAAQRNRFVSASVVAVTGSAAKTTTVKLLAHLLGDPPEIGVSLFNNTARDIFGQFQQIDPAARAVVVEVSEFPVGNLERAARPLRPTAAVLTISGLDHYKEFRGATGAAREMATLARAVPAEGFIVVNGDDGALLEATRDIHVTQVLFGIGLTADFRMTECSFGKGNRLIITCFHRGETVRLHTPFIGKQFYVATMAAVAAAHRLGTPWPTIQSRLQSFEPVYGRCNVVAVPEGPIFICDTMKSPAWSVQSSIETLDAFAESPRRTLVLGTLSDYPGSSRTAYRKAWKHAIDRADRVIFLRHSPSHLGAVPEDIDVGRAVFLPSVEKIAAFIRETVIPGEVILLKGSCPADHLDRIVHDFQAPVSCWLDKCPRSMNCVNCEWMRDRTPLRFRSLKRLQHRLTRGPRTYG